MALLDRDRLQEAGKPPIRPPAMSARPMKKARTWSDCCRWRTGASANCPWARKSAWRWGVIPEVPLKAAREARDGAQDPAWRCDPARPSARCQAAARPTTREWGAQCAALAGSTGARRAGAGLHHWRLEADVPGAGRPPGVRDVTARTSRTPSGSAGLRRSDMAHRVLQMSRRHLALCRGGTTRWAQPCMTSGRATSPADPAQDHRTPGGI